MTPTVLLVDDDPNLLDGLRRALHGEGFRLRCATNADEALRLMRSDRVDIVISDQVMPGISGTEFLTQVQRLFPDTSRVLLTGHATVEMLAEAINKGGIERVYMKPASAEQIATGIQQILLKRSIMTRALQMVEAARQPIAPAAAPSDRHVPGGTSELILSSVPFGWDTLVRRLDEMDKQPGGEAK